MAHYLHPLRLPSTPEKLAFAHPREEGSMRPRLDAVGIDIGARLTPKTPLLIGNLMIIPSDEFVVVERYKDSGKVIIRLKRDNRINIEATMEEIAANFHLNSGEERTLRRADIYPLLGKTVPLVAATQPPMAELAKPPKTEM